MTSGRPWYVDLFERDYYDLLAPGGPGSQVDPDSYQRQTASEVEFIATVLDLPAGAPVLDLCCGWGRHAIPLAGRGLAVSGLDFSAYHLELARKAAAEAGVEVDWVESDMRTIPRPDASLRAVISIFTSFGYLDDTDNQRVLDEVARVLAPGGRFLLDVINRDWMMDAFRETDWTEDAEGNVVLERRSWDATHGRVNVDWTHIDTAGRRRRHHHDERIYTLQELELLLALAGLPVRAAFGGFDGRPLARDSRRLIVLAEKL
jgi:SAM-dependent methyltransferase